MPLQSKNNKSLQLTILYSDKLINFCRILMADAYTSIENTIKYYGDKTNKGIHVPSNFQLIPHDKKSNAIKMVSSINEWLNKMPDGQIANWVVSSILSQYIIF